MARADIVIDVPPERVFAVLADGASYGRWVVGAKEIRAVDRGFPAVGTRFHHRIGVGPLTLADETEVVDARPPYRLELQARARPLGSARVTFLLEPRGEATHLTMLEEGGGVVTRLLLNRFVDPLLVGRNRETLRRLKAIAEDEPSAPPIP